MTVGGDIDLAILTSTRGVKRKREFTKKIVYPLVAPRESKRRNEHVSQSQDEIKTKVC